MDLKIAAGYEVERVGIETAVTCPNGDILVLNETAGTVLEAIAASGCEKHSAEAITRCYGVPIERASTDAAAMVRRLRARGVLVSVQDPKVTSRPTTRYHFPQPRPLTRRAFVAGAAVMGASLLTPSLAFGEESAKVADRAYNGDALGSWGDEVVQEARVWNDSVGRAVEVPTSISRVAPYGPYAQAMLESICPTAVVSVNARGLHASTHVEVQAIAASETQTQGTASIDENVVARESPDVIIDVGDTAHRLITSIDEVQADTDVPVVHIAAKIDDLPQAYRTLGDFLGEPAAYHLADYVAQMLVTFAQGREMITPEMRKKVYFGQGVDGLNTRAAGTLLDDVLIMIGADNVAHDLTLEECFGVGIEQIIDWDSDFVILSIQEDEGEPHQRGIVENLWTTTAEQFGFKVLYTPQVPFDWLHRSPLTMQTLGALWLANVLYPNVYNYDIAQTVSDYFGMFFHRELSIAEIGAMLKAAKIA